MDLTSLTANHDRLLLKGEMCGEMPMTCLEVGKLKLLKHVNQTIDTSLGRSRMKVNCYFLGSVMASQL